MMRVLKETVAPRSSRKLLDDLVDRLNHGEALIRQYKAEAKPVDQLERHWVELLRQYEEAYRSYQSAA